jgi:hypothetical protein
MVFVEGDVNFLDIKPSCDARTKGSERALADAVTLLGETVDHYKIFSQHFLFIEQA